MVISLLALACLGATEKWINPAWCLIESIDRRYTLENPHPPLSSAGHFTRERSAFNLKQTFISFSRLLLRCSNSLCAPILACIWPWLSAFVRFPFPNWGLLLLNYLSNIPFLPLSQQSSTLLASVVIISGFSKQADCPYDSKRVEELVYLH